jgi:hypothetical protein
MSRVIPIPFLSNKKYRSSHLKELAVMLSCSDKHAYKIDDVTRFVNFSEQHENIEFIFFSHLCHHNATNKNFDFYESRPYFHASKVFLYCRWWWWWCFIFLIVEKRTNFHQNTHIHNNKHLLFVWARNHQPFPFPMPAWCPLPLWMHHNGVFTGKKIHKMSKKKLLRKISSHYVIIWLNLT